MIGIEHYLVVSSILFVLGVLGIFLNRKNVIIILMAIELILLSVNLAIMNLLPFPALDGGRLLFMIIEVIRGKRVPPEKEGMVHLAGFVALMVLMVFVMYQDIMRLIK